MLFVLLRDLLGNVMETVEASKVDRLPVRASASKVLEDVAVPEGAVQRKGSTYVSNAVFLDGQYNHTLHSLHVGRCNKHIYFTHCGFGNLFQRFCMQATSREASCRSSSMGT